MGFATSVTHLIFFMSFLFIAGLLIGSGLNYQRVYENAKDTRDRMDLEMERSSLERTNIVQLDDRTVLTLENDGDCDIDLDQCDILVDGVLKSGATFTVSDNTATVLKEDENLELEISNTYLNASDIGGDRNFRSDYQLSDPSRMSAANREMVLDGTLVRCFGIDGDYQWSISTGLSDPSDIFLTTERALVLGDDEVHYADSDGTTAFQRIVENSSISGGYRLIQSDDHPSDPYILVLEDDGDIIRFDHDGTSPVEICTNGTNVNWSSPVDLIPGNGSFRLIDGDGKLYNISYTGWDSIAASFTLTGSESPVSATSTGYQDGFVLVLMRDTASSRVACFNVFNSTFFDIIQGAGNDVIDISAGTGLFLLDGGDEVFSGHDIGTTIKIAFLNGHIHTEVV